MSTVKEHWTYDQITDPDFLASLVSRCDELKGKVRIDCSDGSIVVGARQALLNLMWWPILSTFHIPIRKDHFIKRIPPSQGNLVKEWNRYYDEIMDIDPHNGPRLKRAVWETNQRLYDFAYSELLPYMSTIDIMDMADIMTDPPMDEIIRSKDDIDQVLGTNVIEKLCDAASKKIINLLSTEDALANDALYPYQVAGQLNKFQIPQCMFAYGPRTDINGNIVGYSVLGSAVEGLRNIWEYGVESLSAYLAAVNNHSAVSTSQYTARRLHLLASTIRKVYRGDCGTTVTIDFDVTETNYKNIEGSYIVEDGRLVLMTRDNVANYIGKKVKLRNPLGCRCRDGVCEICGGRVVTNVSVANIGILSAIRAFEPITQMILSTKHLIRTLSLVFLLNEELATVLIPARANELHWSQRVARNINRLTFGIPLSSFSNLNDVTLLRDGKAVPENTLSSIRAFFLKDDKGDIATYQFDNGQNIHLPYLSKDILFYIRDHFDELKIEDDIVWIPLRGTDRKPIFKTVVMNDSAVDYVKSVTKFLVTDIAKFTSCTRALERFTDIVYARVNTNLIHMSILLKAFLITADGDYGIPIVTDPDKVRFQSLPKIVENRHIGTECAYQHLFQFATNIGSYINLRQPSVFDSFIGYSLGDDDHTV